jgi:hypothetical protein
LALQTQTSVAGLQIPPEPPVRHAVSLPLQPQRFATVSPHESPAPCAVQELPQPPQLVSLVAACVSQPSSLVGAAGLAQLALPSWQLELHLPALHASDATPLVLHARLQAPQCAGLVASSTSQPLGAAWSQSAKPASQLKSQTPFRHWRTAFGGLGHAALHAPQWFGSELVATHWPAQLVVPDGQLETH